MKGAQGERERVELKRQTRRAKWVKEVEELCRSKWLELIRHETLQSGATEADGARYEPVSQSVQTGTQQDSNLTVIHSFSLPDQTLKRFSI